MLRFATSPNGDMYTDDLLVAILNYLVAQQREEQFLVRIEDIDIETDMEGKDTEIMMILEKFALKHSAVFHQTEHLNLHQTLAIRLIREEKAFICRCVEEDRCSRDCKNLTKEEQSKDEFITRIDKESITILKKDGKPTRDFAVACDDMMSDISSIISKDCDIENSSKHETIKSLLGYDKKIKYHTTPNVKNNTSIKELFLEGFIPDAILNYLLLLVNPTTAPREIFTLPEAIDWFNLDLMVKKEIEFDIEKLKNINSEHLKRIDNKEMSKLFGFADEDIGKLAKLYLEEATTIKELEKIITPIFKPKNFNVELGDEMKIISDIIFDSPAFEEFEEFREYTLKRTQLEENIFDKALAYLLTNREDSSKLSQIYPYIKSYILEVAS